MEKKDIWREGIKSIMGYTKRSLLDYVDACNRQNTDPKITEMLGKIKGRIHNDVSQAELMVGILFATKDAGGDISDFQNEFQIPSRKNHVDKFFTGRGDKLENTVLK